MRPSENNFQGIVLTIDSLAEHDVGFLSWFISIYGDSYRYCKGMAKIRVRDLLFVITTYQVQ